MNEDKTEGIITGADGRDRCWWCGHDPFYQTYHDLEWGRPVRDEQRLFEKICLETFQSGLSWLTVLRKRENFRKAFVGFDPVKMASFGDKDIERLMADAGIIRNRQKITAAITNARALCVMHDRGETLADFFWSQVPPSDERPPVMTKAALLPLSESPTSRLISRELKSRGFVWLGPVTMYAHMQAMGLVNDHVEGCHVREVIEKMK